MEWTCTHLRYLLAIYTLSQKAPNVGAAAVARALGVSCPSVTRMLGILTQRGLLERERYGKIHLTDQGLVLARTFSRKVALVTERLPRMELALAEEELYQAACLLASRSSRAWSPPRDSMWWVSSWERVVSSSSRQVSPSQSSFFARAAKEP